jgi:hypothetical protein
MLSVPTYAHRAMVMAIKFTNDNVINRCCNLVNRVRVYAFQKRFAPMRMSRLTSNNSIMEFGNR